MTYLEKRNFFQERLFLDLGNQKTVSRKNGLHYKKGFSKIIFRYHAPYEMLEI
jgi:hypothetical protein